MGANRKMFSRDIAIMEPDFMETFIQKGGGTAANGVMEITCSLVDLSDTYGDTREQVMSSRSIRGYDLPKTAHLIFAKSDAPLQFEEIARCIYGSVPQMFGAMLQGQVHFGLPGSDVGFKKYFDKTGVKIHPEGKCINIFGMISNSAQLKRHHLAARIFSSIEGDQSTWIRHGELPVEQAMRKNHFDPILWGGGYRGGHFYGQSLTSKVHSMMLNQYPLMGSDSMISNTGWYPDGFSPITFLMASPAAADFGDELALKISREITKLCRQSYFTHYFNEVARMSSPLFGISEKYAHRTVFFRSPGSEREPWINPLPVRRPTSCPVISVKCSQAERRLRTDIALRALDTIDVTDGPTLLIMEDQLRYGGNNPLWSVELWSADQSGGPGFMHRVVTDIEAGLQRLGGEFSINYYKSFVENTKSDRVRLLNIGQVDKIALEKTGKLLFLPPIMRSRTSALTSSSTFSSVRMDTLRSIAQALVAPSVGTTVLVPATGRIQKLDD